MSNKNCHEVRDEPDMLIVAQCDRCSFRLGVDASFLRNHTVRTLCIGCGLELEIEEIE